MLTTRNLHCNLPVGLMATTNKDVNNRLYLIASQDGSLLNLAHYSPCTCLLEITVCANHHTVNCRVILTASAGGRCSIIVNPGVTVWIFTACVRVHYHRTQRTHSSSETTKFLLFSTDNQFLGFYYIRSRTPNQTEHNGKLNLAKHN